MKANPWRDCKTDPPRNYVRVEIRDKKDDHFIGYRCDKQYYETYGNYLIKEPRLWRFPPKGSALITELKEKLHTFLGGEIAYDTNRE